MLNEFDKHHLNLIKNSILNFQKREEIDLDSLLLITKSIEEILNVLKNLDKHFKEDLITEWSELEIISSLMMADEEEEATLDDESRKTIFYSLENIKEMINAALNNRIMYFKQDSN